ncbi:hypothetical protein BC962_2580 [Gillisia mitskevichiae]|uniref:Uncharacterized protein n=1 Tax=Gillisia mitskevichiae TaxID=270921 RepID=A0A495P621_9FLAO|nr:hypothetical protein BC962_2580 [Gillisia mitskevichiae]
MWLETINIGNCSFNRILEFLWNLLKSIAKLMRGASLNKNKNIYLLKTK